MKIPITSGRIALLLILNTTLIGLLPLTDGNAVDLDHDSIDDDCEGELAKRFLPRLFYTEDEYCYPPGLILYHVRPYVPGGSLDDGIAISYSMLYYDDCK